MKGRGVQTMTILFNIFLNELFLWLTKSNLHNFADVNTITATFKNRDDHLRTLGKESESAVDWFRNNNKIADKFHAIIMNKRSGNQIMHKLKIYNNKIEITSINILYQSCVLKLPCY